MKKTLKTILSTTLLASASFMATNAVATCNGSSSACPTDIMTNTMLTSDCKGPIKVLGNNLTLNLGGHTVCESATFGIKVEGRRVTIKNGYVKNNGWSAIWMKGKKGRVENINASNNHTETFNIDARKVSVINSNIHENDGDGIFVHFAAKYVTVTNTTIEHNNGDGIYTGADNGSYFLNHARVNNDRGINVQGAFVIAVADSDSLYDSYLSSGGAAKSNEFYFNSATHNGDIDLYEGNACGSNAWYFNTWNSKNKTCIH